MYIGEIGSSLCAKWLVCTNNRELSLGDRTRGANSDIIEYPVFAHVHPPPPLLFSVVLVLLLLRFSARYTLGEYYSLPFFFSVPLPCPAPMRASEEPVSTILFPVSRSLVPPSPRGNHRRTTLLSLPTEVLLGRDVWWVGCRWRRGSEKKNPPHKSAVLQPSKSYRNELGRWRPCTGRRHGEASLGTGLGGRQNEPPSGHEGNF